MLGTIERETFVNSGIYTVDYSQNEELASRAKQGDSIAKEHLYCNVEKLIFSLMQKYFSLCVDVPAIESDDLLQAGYLAFENALKYYNSEGDLKFTSFLAYNVQSLANETLELRSKKQREKPPCDSLDESVIGTEDISLVDTIEDPTALEAFEEVQENITQEQFKTAIFSCMGGLTKREREVILEVAFTEQNQGEIATKLGVTGEAVRQTKARAIQKIQRNPNCMSLLRPFVEHHYVKSYDVFGGQGYHAFKSRGYKSKTEQLLNL